MQTSKRTLRSDLPNNILLAIVQRVRQNAGAVFCFIACWLIGFRPGFGQPAVTDSTGFYRARLVKNYKIGVSAHRGASGIAPENTLATFWLVLQMQVDYIEIDIRTTKDGQLVILHDATLNRTTNGAGPLNGQTLAELKKLSAAKGAGESFQSEQIPSLEEVCQLLADWNAHHQARTKLYVDCKDVAPAPMVAILTQYGLLTDAVFYGSDDNLLALQKVAPLAKLMPSLNKADMMTDKIEKLHPYAFDVSWPAVTEALVENIHQQQIKVFSDLLGGYDSVSQYEKAARLGVDVIQTDHVLHVYKALSTEAVK
ncbi:glycerophosphodiester phosphodiesterase [Spirosoma pollinicola]|uniref:Glycerophosphodiester phosphodiesterase n=1 Tax=Spirosoma pollinicola TaxID=2057025 RepID=A0A2K8Z548_9BACT|nr:glycerophosphodiester phosphodiesterase family protein [Spirosoma pollinicola]AUD05003.1 glycerophosphodiester phosphodiesterase [Spirosoma pollinicola]